MIKFTYIIFDRTHQILNTAPIAAKFIASFTIAAISIATTRYAGTCVVIRGGSVSIVQLCAGRRRIRRT